MSGFIEVPVGNGHCVRIYAVPSGWRYETGSSRAIMGNVGPYGGGHVDGTLVVAVSQGASARANQYRLRFDGWGVSLAKGASTPISDQKSSETMRSWALGQVLRLPRSGAPMGQAQEAGSPTGFAGPFLLASFDRGAGVGISTCLMFLGGTDENGSSFGASLADQIHTYQYKYLLMFEGLWMGSTAGIGVSYFRGAVSQPFDA